jgi:hypothetical protein
MAGEVVLIAQPVREGTPVKLLERASDLVNLLTWPDFECFQWINKPIDVPQKYGAHAHARNSFIELFLDDDHDYVLWIDVDLTDIPRDLVEQLVKASKKNRGAIVAPMAWDERGRFYDLGGFVKSGQWADPLMGVPGDEPIVEMESVGCCYLVPAWLYREGLRYTPEGDEIEHVSFCRAARERVKVLALRDVCVFHAYLPNYGERVHV